jgi:hypothetical protein
LIALGLSAAIGVNPIAGVLPVGVAMRLSAVGMVAFLSVFRFFVFAFFGAQFRNRRFGGRGTAICVGFYGAIELVVALRNSDLGCLVADFGWTMWDWALIAMHFVYAVAVIGIVIAATLAAVRRKKVAAFGAMVLVVVASMLWTEGSGAWWNEGRTPTATALMYLASHVVCGVLFVFFHHVGRA